MYRIYLKIDATIAIPFATMKRDIELVVKELG